MVECNFLLWRSDGQLRGILQLHPENKITGKIKKRAFVKCASEPSQSSAFSYLLLHVTFEQIDPFRLLSSQLNGQQFFNMDPFEAEIHSVVESFNKV